MKSALKLSFSSVFFISYFCLFGFFHKSACLLTASSLKACAIQRPLWFSIKTLVVLASAIQLTVSTCCNFLRSDSQTSVLSPSSQKAAMSSDSSWALCEEVRSVFLPNAPLGIRAEL